MDGMDGISFDGMERNAESESATTYSAVPRIKGLRNCGALTTHRQTDKKTDKKTKRQKDRHTDRQTKRQTDKKTDRQKDRQTDRQKDSRVKKPRSSKIHTHTHTHTHMPSLVVDQHSTAPG